MIVGMISLCIHPQVGVTVLVQVDVIVPKGVPLHNLSTDTTSSDPYLLPITLVIALQMCLPAEAWDYLVCSGHLV